MDTGKELIEELVKEFGEPRRKLIEDALQFLDENEGRWGLSTPIEKRVYIRRLIQGAS
jgi:hypothetical protein